MTSMLPRLTPPRDFATVWDGPPGVSSEDAGGGRRQFATGAACVAYLIPGRWPEGFVGPDVLGSSRDPDGHSSAVPVSALPLSGVRKGFDASRGRGSLPCRDGYARASGRFSGSAR
jgi:hypothetical protein